jgi:hypothetical protein
VTGIVLLAVMRQKTSNTFYDNRLRTAILINAGSDETVASVFQWVSMPEDMLPEFKPIDQTTWKPGISSFASHLKDIDSYFYNLFMHIKMNMNMNPLLWSSVPIYLKATAGMRLLNPEDQQAIMTRILACFSASGFQFNNASASIISEKDEILYTWMAVNYMEGRTLHQFPTRFYGVMDIGDTSTQIALTAAPSDALHLIPTKNVTIANHEYPLYIQSWPGYGVNDFRSKVYTDCVHKYLERKHQNNTVPIACMNEDYTDTFLLNQTTYQLYGTGNMNGCVQDILYSMNKGNNDFPWLPSADSYPSFIGVGGFNNIIPFFIASSLYTLKELTEKVDKYCKLNWIQVQIQYPLFSQNLLANYCFAGTYVHTLLTHQYHFDQKRVDQFSVGDYSWSLGAMLYEEGEGYGIQPTKPFLLTAPGIVLMVICCCILLVCLILALVGLCLYYVSYKRSFPTEKPSTS